MSDQRPTVHDVAQAAGVSAMSVSRVLNGRPGVGASTAKRIEDAMRALGYRPNMLATSFRQQGRLSLIGMVVPDLFTPLFTSIAVSVDERVRSEGLIVVTASSDGRREQERELVRAFMDRGFDGILLFSEDTDHGYLEAELARGRPMVFLGSPPVGVRAASVLVENRGGARQAVEHLLDQGHRRIGILTNSTRYPARERLLGYQETLQDHGIDVDTDLVEDGITTGGEAEVATRRLLHETDATAIFSTNYVLTAGALPAWVPHRHRATLVGFDDFQAAALMDPPVSVVTQDPAAMGRHAARLLLGQLKGGRAPRKPTLVEPHLIARGRSTPH